MVFLLSREMFISVLILALNIYKSSYNLKSFSIHCHELKRSNNNKSLSNIYLQNYKIICAQ